MQDRRKEDANLLALHEQNRQRLDALAATQTTLRSNQDAMRSSIEDLTARIEEHEQDGVVTNRELAKIKTALFNDEGESRLQQILDVMTTLKMNGKALAWIAIVIGGLGTALGALWNHIFHA